MGDMADWAIEQAEIEALEEDLRPRRRKATETTWVTKHGVAVEISDMDDLHLLNTIAFIEREFRRLQDDFRGGALDIDRLFPSHAGMVREARRRRLIPRGKAAMVTG